MMNSMTGYGKGIAESDNRKVTVEMKSVNHRFLDLMFKIPKNYQFAEDTLRKIIAKNFVRGHVELYLNYEDNRENKKELTIDYQQAKKYLNMTKELVAMGYNDNFGVAEALNISDIVKSTLSEDDENIVLALIEQACQQATASLLTMRRAEGEKLIADIKLKLEDISTAVNDIEKRAPFVAEDYKNRLTLRVQEALALVEIDENKLASEVAFFADRANIDEELTRLKGHLSHYNEIIQNGGAVGKKLDFLTQETHREINTIGSKSNDMTITKLVLYLKSQVEMIREQVQNLE